MRSILLVATALLFFCVAQISAEERDHGALARNPGPLKGLIRGAYVDVPSGQIHMRIVTPAGDTDKVPFLMFHPSPGSSISYAYLLEEMGTDRTALAFDTPGFGNSSKPSGPRSIAEYATTMAAALENLGYGAGGKGKVDVSGYHTGTVIATELAVTRPDLVRRVVLIGVPFSPSEELRKYVRARSIEDIGSTMSDNFETAVTSKNPDRPLERLYDMVIEGLRNAPHAWWAYNAVAEYPATERFETLIQPVLLLNTHGIFREETRAVLPHLKNGRIVEEPGLTNSVFDVGSPVLGRHIRAFLDAEL